MWTPSSVNFPMPQLPPLSEKGCIITSVKKVKVLVVLYTVTESTQWSWNTEGCHWGAQEHPGQGDSGTLGPLVGTERERKVRMSAW